MYSLIAALFATLVVWSGFQTGTDGLVQSFWYQITPDEALHTEVAEVLMQTGSYANWKGNSFVPAITTGPALILPAAAVAKVTGLSTARSARGVSFLYYLGCLVLIVLLLKENLVELLMGSRFPFVFSAAIALGLYHIGYRGLHDTGYYVYGVMGEGASAFYLLLCAYFFGQKDYFWAGAASVLAVFSKTFMVLLPAVFLALLGLPVVLEWMKGKPKKVHTTRRHVMFRAGTNPGTQFPFFMGFMGVLFPTLFWLGWMVHTLDVRGTWEFWETFPSVMRNVNGAGLPPSESLNLMGILAGVGAHFRALGALFKFRALLFGFGGLALVLLGNASRSAFRLLFTFSVAHLFWWFLLSPGAEARYIFPAAVGAWACFAVLGTSILIQRAPVFDLNERWISAFLVVTAFYFLRGAYLEYQDLVGDYDSCALCRQVKIQEYWKDHAQELSRGSQVPVLYSTSLNYGKDLDLVLSAPHVRLNAGTDRKGLFLVGEEPDGKRVAEIISDPNCLPKFVLSRKAIGIWECR